MSEHDNSPEPTTQDRPLISAATRMRDDDRIPPGYALFRRDVRLLNGQVEPAFYSTREGQLPDPDAWEHSSDSVIEGFAWALKVEAFADHQTDDDDRTLEIGNMMSFAISQGLTEEQVVECYEQAFAIASQQ